MLNRGRRHYFAHDGHTGYAAAERVQCGSGNDTHDAD